MTAKEWLYGASTQEVKTAIATLCVLFLGLCALDCGRKANTPEIAFFSVNLTPPVGIPNVSMFPVTGLHDSLYAKGVVLKYKDDGYAVVTLDVVELDTVTLQTIRRRISTETEIPGQHIILSMTHTHGSPWYSVEFITGRLASDPSLQSLKTWSLKTLPSRIARGVREALARTQPFQLSVTRVHIDSIASNRRVHVRPDTVVQRSVQPELRKYPVGTIDPEALIFTFYNTRGTPMAAMVNYACHPVTAGWAHLLITADFTGLAMTRLEKRFEYPFMFFQGCSGDINPGYFTQGKYSLQEAAVFAGRFAEQIASQIVATSPHPVNDIGFQTVRFACPPFEQSEFSSGHFTQVIDSLFDAHRDNPITQWSSKDISKLGFAVLDQALTRPKGAAPVQTTCSALTIDDDAFVFLPGEMFVKFGLQIKRQSPFKTTAVIELCDEIGYVPTRNSYREGGYEPTYATVAPGGGEAITDSALALLKRLSQ